MPHSTSSRRARAAAAIVLLSVAAACHPPANPYRLRDLAMSCEEANRYSLDTMKSLNFSISAYEPARTGSAGVLKGSRQRPGAEGERQSATVTIHCHPGGATIDVAEDGRMRAAELERGFYYSFVSLRSMAAAQATAGKAPPKANDLQILVVPVHGPESKLDFGLDLAAAGILPVRVRAHNRTARRYRLDAAEVRLLRADRERTAPLSATEAASRVSGARRADGEPITSLTADQVVRRLEEKSVPEHELEPRSDVGGFLYFPLGDYVRARVVVTDLESGESEGFAVEF